MKIDNYISELLYEHDCVIVTDLGGFITHYRPATLNKIVNTLNPPSKKVAFNASLKNNDGLLAHHISSREALNYADATKVIAEFAQQANAQLKGGKKLKIEKVGILYHDKDQNIQFLPDQNANFLIESFGLSPIHAKVLNKEEPLDNVESAELNFVDHNNEPTLKKQPFKWKLVEVIPAAAILALLLMVPPVLDNFNTNVSSLLPFSRMNEYIDDFKGITHERAPIIIEYSNPFDVPPVVTDHSQFDEAGVTDNQAANDNTIVDSTTDDFSSTDGNSETNVEPNASVNNKLGYHIIGGCFQYQSNAENLINQLLAKNIEAEIIGQNKNGLYMVSLFNSNNFKEAKVALDEIKESTIANAWIYTK